MFANTLSSGVCVPIHQPQTHLCNLGGNLSEERWAAESPPHCLAAGSKHTAARQHSGRENTHKRTKWPAVFGKGHRDKLRDGFWVIYLLTLLHTDLDSSQFPLLKCDVCIVAPCQASRRRGRKRKDLRQPGDEAQQYRPMEGGRG